MFSLNLLRLSLLELLLLFFIILLITTYTRKYLTAYGIQCFYIIILIILFFYCFFLWHTFILDHRIENFSFKINSNNWSNISYELSFKINSLSFLFILLVLTIGLATNFYILNYFKLEERNEEFTLLINWFIFSMIFLVIGNNFFTIFLGWELIGLTSFLLINFWKFKITTLSCSFKAFVFNKISDVFLMISFAILWNAYKVDDLDILFTLISYNPGKFISTLFFSGFFMIISASIKSAQIIGHLWLPDSMEAPIPASSLIHSATLVSAGIYLILKFNIIFYYSNLYNIIFMLGSITAFYGGITAAAQTDMKKLLAYSTISHCGFIFASLSLNNFIITIVYLYLHGLFKALTFFCAGSIIKYNNTQDMRQMGALRTQFLNIIMLVIASINLGGLPFTFGYLYKDLLLHLLIINPVNILGYGFIICGMLSSVVYVYKLIYYSCFDFRKGDQDLIILNLQNNSNNNKFFITLFTFSKYISFFIIYLFSIFFFIIIKYYILKNYLFFYYFNGISSNDFIFLFKYTKLQNYLVSLFYIFFLLTLFILIFQNWRANFFFIEKLELILIIILIIFFIILFSNIIFQIFNFFF